MIDQVGKIRSITGAFIPVLTVLAQIQGLEDIILPVWTRKGGEVMQYTKPVIVAQNNKNGSFAAGCPEKDNCNGSTWGEPNGRCSKCERTK